MPIEMGYTKTDNFLCTDKQRKNVSMLRGEQPAKTTRSCDVVRSLPYYSFQSY